MSGVMNSGERGNGSPSSKNENRSLDINKFERSAADANHAHNVQKEFNSKSAVASNNGAMFFQQYQQKEKNKYKPGNQESLLIVVVFF